MPSPLTRMLPLFLVLFIDGMGLGIIFPILNPVYMDIHQGILSPIDSIGFRNFMYGLTLFVFPFGMFFGTPVLGDMSDAIGRKRVLLICLLGAAIGYFFAAVGVEMKLPWMLLLGRLIAGFTAASQSVAQAAIIDIAPADKKAQYIGYLMFPVALGFVAGPLLSGYLSDPHLVSWFTLMTPLYVACILSLINAVYLWRAFHETHTRKGKVSFALHRGVSLFLSAFKHEGIRYLSVGYLFMGLGWACYFQFISLYLTQHYGYTAQKLGIFMAVIGLGFALGLTYFIKLFVKRNHARVICGCWAVTTICIFITILSNVAWPAWVVAVPIAISMACAYSLVLTLFSNQVGPERQGWIMGVSMSVMAFGWAIMAILPTFLMRFGDHIPLLTAGVSLAIASLLMYRYTRRPDQRKTA